MAKIQAPSGTRDMYPADLLKRRYIEKLWRDTSIRHGFEEIDGPTFETADLYAVKSGEGILSEVFQVYSGKDEAEVSRIRGGANAPYALRPEFTPTLARMYAAKAGSLAKPTKWFWQQNCFRAEKQQRGRLREFGQWNCDILGGENDAESRARVDADVIACAVGAFLDAGLTSTTLQVHVSDRSVVGDILRGIGVLETRLGEAFSTLDRLPKLPPQAGEEACRAAGFDLQAFTAAAAALDGKAAMESASPLSMLRRDLASADLGGWVKIDLRIARGLAYYTGTVFEVLADGERAIAGGGRYDNLIELFGGPATPAVGFGMGDVVLSLVLQDRGLLPEGDALMDALSRPSASYRPEAIVIARPPEKERGADGQKMEASEAELRRYKEALAMVRPIVARLRRGQENPDYLSREGRKPWDADRYRVVQDSHGTALVAGEKVPASGVPPMHARSGKEGANIGKLLQDAAGQKAKLAVIVENAEEVTIKDLRTNQQDATRTKIAELGRVVAERLGM